MSRNAILRWVRLAFGRVAPTTQGQRRYTRVTQSALSAAAGRGVALVVSVVSVPLTIGYLGAERYGVWVAILTLLAWFTLADLGLGSGLTNALSTAYGESRRDLAQSQVASTFWLLLFVSCLLGLALLLAWPWLDWVTLLNVKSREARFEVELAVALGFALTLIGIPVGVGSQVWNAYQEGAIANYWTAAGSVACLIALVVVTQSGGGLTALVLGFTGGQVLMSVLSVVWLFRSNKPWLAPLWSKAQLRQGARLLKKGGEFLLVQVSVLLLFHTDSIIIARFLGPEQVAEYSVTFRLFNYVLVIQTLVMTPLWPAYVEASAQGDWEWIRGAFRRTLMLGMPIITVLILCLAVGARPIIAVWTRGEVSVSPSLVTLMAVWTWMWTFGQTFGYLQVGLGRVRAQSLIHLVVAVADVVLSIVLVQQMGVTGAILATVIAYGAVALWATPLDVTRTLRRQR